LRRAPADAAFPDLLCRDEARSAGLLDLLVEEDRKFNADHCVVGYLVARHWHLPEFICDAIRYHHAINELDMHASRTMVAILQLAIDIYYRDQRVPHPEWELVQDEVMAELGLDGDALLEFVDIIIERFHGDAH
jgi:HD-like signal output (HDOD) protein